MGGICLVCLADGAPLNILLYKFLHFGPPVVLRNGKKGAGYPWVSCSWCIVVLLGYLPPKIVIFHNNKTARMPPMKIVRRKGITGAQGLYHSGVVILGSSNTAP